MARLRFRSTESAFQPEVLGMKLAMQSLVQELPRIERAQNELGFFSSESVLNILKLILAGSELSEVLTIIARLVESQGNGTLCTIWLPDADGKQLYCAPRPVFLDLLPASGRRLLVRKAHPAARLFIGGSRSMSLTSCTSPLGRLSRPVPALWDSRRLVATPVHA